MTNEPTNQSVRKKGEMIFMAEKTYNNGIRNFIWTYLVEFAKKSKKGYCYYSDVVYKVYEKYQISLPNEIGYLLGPIMEYCDDNNLPPLTSLVVNKKYRIPGKGLITCEISNQDDLEKVHKRVRAYKWDKIQNPFAKYGLKLSKKVSKE